jgi:acetyltransferase-like isoleucine patch superfamily enzyme
VTRMKRKGRLIVLALLAMLPLVISRVFYRWFFGYRIGHRVRLGMVLLDCQTLCIGDGARIGHGTLFWRCGRVAIGKEVSLGPLNLFRGGESIEIGDYATVLRLNVINAIPDHDLTNGPESVFTLGIGSVLTAEHRIDFTDRVSIGQGSILGGRNSSIWTHNRRTGGPVTIGDSCYLGSEIRIAPGGVIPDRCIVGLGAVITGELTEVEMLYGGVPARAIRPLTNEDLAFLADKTRPDLPMDGC